MKKVVIGLSGGVDSSVAAYLLKNQGYNVHALYMINWKDSSVTLSGDCSWEEDKIVAELVAKKLNIPLTVVDSSERYMKNVVDYMFYEYEQGRTPNPDVLCNREIKFNVFNEEAQRIGADYVATGHYCKKRSVVKNGKEFYRLIAGADNNKDQSYFLCQLSQEQLKNVLFPIGDISKPEVRKIAHELGLASADKKDSQGICFVGKVDLPTFLQQKIAAKTGNIIEIPENFNTEISFKAKENFTDDDLIDLAKPYDYKTIKGKKVGQHQGAHFYTIGQRKGLNVGGTAKPLYVIATDTETNVVYVGQGSEHIGLFRKALFLKNNDIHWIRPDLKQKTGTKQKYLVRIRYRQPLQKAELYFRDEGIYIVFEELQRGISAGQFAAWYDNDELIGSGIIQA